MGSSFPQAHLSTCVFSQVRYCVGGVWGLWPWSSGKDAGLRQEPLFAFPSTVLSHSLAIVSKVFYYMDISSFNSQKNLWDSGGPKSSRNKAKFTQLDTWLRSHPFFLLTARCSCPGRTSTGTKRILASRLCLSLRVGGEGAVETAWRVMCGVILEEGTVSLTFQRKNPIQEQSQAPGWTTAQSSGWRKIQSPFQGSCEMKQRLKFLRALPLAFRCSCVQSSTQEARSTVTAQPPCTLGQSRKGLRWAQEMLTVFTSNI